MSRKIRKVDMTQDRRIFYVEDSNFRREIGVKGVTFERAIKLLRNVYDLHVSPEIKKRLYHRNPSTLRREKKNSAKLRERREILRAKRKLKRGKKDGKEIFIERN